MLGKEKIAHLARRSSNDTVEVKLLEIYVRMTPNYYFNGEPNDIFFIICPVPRQPKETPDDCLARAHRLAREYNIIGQSVREKAEGGK